MYLSDLHLPQIQVPTISLRIYLEKTYFENGFHEIESYPEPWHIGDVGFCRRRISTADLNDLNQRPRNLPDGFPSICRRKAPIALKLGNSVGTGALHENKMYYWQYIEVSPPFTDSRGSPRENFGSQCRIPQNKNKEHRVYPGLVQGTLVNSVVSLVK